MFKKIIQLLLPPIIPYLYLKFFSSLRKSLFDGDDFLFKKSLEGIKIYGEYGCGLSSKWMLKNTNCKVISVDSSKEWVEKIKTENKKYLSKLKINHIDLGKVRRWGFPLSYVKSNNFQDYTDYIWKQSESPKLVLVDGRFRVCCFLTSLKFAEAGTKIIFDDYVNSPHYHFIEKYDSFVHLRGVGYMIPGKNDDKIRVVGMHVRIRRGVLFGV